MRAPSVFAWSGIVLVLAGPAAASAPDATSQAQADRAFEHAWAGELDKANREFEEVRRSDPTDYDLWMGQNLVVNWMGDHLKAWDAYSQVARVYPDRSGPWVGMAAAQNWAGRRDLALESLSEARKRDPEDRESLRLENSIRDGLRPRAGAFYDWNEDSDHYQVNSLWAEAEIWAHPQLEIVPFFNLAGIRRPEAPEIDETWIGVTAVSRPVTPLGLWGRIGFLTNPEDGTDQNPVIARLAADITTTDRVRTSVGYEHFAVVSYQTLPDKITGDVVSASVEIRPDWLTRLRLEGDHARYAEVAGFESNNRWNLSVSGSRQVWSPARLRAGVMARYLDFEKVQDNGIWTPDDFWVVAGTGEFEWGPRERWAISGGVEMGPAREAGGETTLFLSWRAGAYVALGDYLLEAALGHSEGNVSTWTGYDRTFSHVGVRKRF